MTIQASARRFFRFTTPGESDDVPSFYCSIDCTPERTGEFFQLSDEIWTAAGNGSVCVEPYPNCVGCGCRIPILFDVGNVDGPWFAQDHLDQLAKDIEAWAPYGLGVREFGLYYDAEQDFHCLSFAYAGHTFVVQSYKILGLLVDGEKHASWRCSRYSMDELVEHVRTKYGAKSDAE